MRFNMLTSEVPKGSTIPQDLEYHHWCCVPECYLRRLWLCLANATQSV